MGSYNYTISIGHLGEQLTLNQWVLGSSPRWCTRNSFTQSVGLFFQCNNPGCRNSLCTIGGREQLVPAVRSGGQKGSSGPFLERGRVLGERKGKQGVPGVEIGVSRRGGFAFGLHARRTRTGRRHRSAGTNSLADCWLARGRVPGNRKESRVYRGVILPLQM